jgi:dienelactone hydrolase
MERYPTYHKNYENAPPNDMEFQMAVMSRKVPYVIRNCYTFTGWYTEPECVNKVDPDPYGEGEYYAGWRPWTDAEREKMENYLKVITEAKYIIARPKAYTWDSFLPFFFYANKLIFEYERFSRPLDEEADRLLAGLASTKKKLVQVMDPEESIWYIWGDNGNNMPQEKDASNYDYFYRFDYPGFKPCIVPYMLPDQSKVKGNIIVIAGGGFSLRWNQTEGYCVAEEFNKRGYNAFVLQRRLLPSPRLDALLDLQRAVRYLKFNASKHGIGAIEHIATNGYSGGGGTIIGALEECYGLRTPNEFYPNYVCDEIDFINSDYEAALLIYGGFAPRQTGNKNLPAIFAAVGARDSLIFRGGLGRLETFTNLMQSNPELDLELHIFAGTEHGFGTGYAVVEQLYSPSVAYIGTDRWMDLADDFLQVRFGLIPRTYKKGCRPVPMY